MSFIFADYRESLGKLTLDDLLNQLEIDLTKVGHGNPESALKMLLKMDQVFFTIEEMSQKENPIKAEAAQFDYVTNSLEKNCRNFLKDVGGKEKLASYRLDFSPGAKQRWWFIDLTYEQQVRSRLRHLGLVFGAFVAILGLFAIIYQNFLAPDPTTAKRYSLEIDADQAIGQGDYNQALDIVGQALALSPQDARLMILRGVLYDRSDKKAESSADFAKAETLMNNREQFLLSRADAWMKIGDLANGLQDTQECIRENPNSAEGYFYYGKVSELMKDYVLAIDNYTKASQLADQQGKTELNATVRISLAMLMQTLPVFQPANSATPTQ